MPLVHHELCFGCGRANLFGLLVELEPTAAGAIAGRCFIKQDHQGPQRGRAHDGVIMAALSEAIAFACGPDQSPRELTVELRAPVPVGTFLELQADVHDSGVNATARLDGQLVARASASLRR